MQLGASVRWFTISAPLTSCRHSVVDAAIVEEISELTRPWKLATLCLGIGLLLVGAGYYQAPDWDVPISLIMAVVAYVTAPWSMRVMVTRQWRMWPMMAFLTWFGVDGCYWLYWSWKNPVALELMRSANAPASLSLYWMCGLVWYYRGTMKEMKRDAIGAMGYLFR